MDFNHLPLHIGQIKLLPQSEFYSKSMKESEDYVNRTHERMKLFEKFKTSKEKVFHLKNLISDREDKCGEIINDIEAFRMTRDFDWQVEMRHTVQKLKSEMIVHKKELEYATEILEEISHQIQGKYPDMSSSIQQELGGVSLNDDIEDNTGLSLNTVSQLEISNLFGDTSGQVFGWILGRVSKEGQILKMLFGKFTKEKTVPSTGWMYMGYVADRSIFVENVQDSSQAFQLPDDYPYLSENSETEPEPSVTPSTRLNSPSKSNIITFPDNPEQKLLFDEILKSDTLKVSMLARINQSFSSTKSNSESSETIRSFYVTGCSFEEVNGRYLEWGKACQELRFRNVKGWVLFRHRFNEIPDLGIFADNCYNALEGPSMSLLQDQKAAIAVNDLLQKNSNVKEGGPRFKRRFAEIARAGMRLINIDQNSIRMHDEQLRANARAESNKAMLLQLQAMALKKSQEDSTYTLTNDKFQSTQKSDNLIDAIATEISKEKNNNKNVTFQESLDVQDFSKSFPSSYKATTSQDNYVTGTELEFKVTMSRNIDLQAGSLAIERSKGGDRFLNKEAELKRAALAYVEVREAEVLKLKFEAAKMQKYYLESEERSHDMKESYDIQPLLNQMSRVREATVLVSEAIGGWVRLVLNKGKRNKSTRMSDPREGREYCVVIAVKGPTLYPQSAAVNSGMRRFRRSAESFKSAINICYIGVFKEKDDAVKNFQVASAAVPLELRAKAYTDAPRMMIGLRACGRHYLVRSESVPPDLPCQECNANNFGKPNEVVPKVKEGILPEFLWHGVNYLDKLWTDLDFLNDVLILENLIPNVSFKFNPLLLPHDRLKQALHHINSSNAFQGSHSLRLLKGYIEQVDIAKEAADRANEVKIPPDLMGLPYAALENGNSQQLMGEDVKVTEVVDQVLGIPAWRFQREDGALALSNNIPCSTPNVSTKKISFYVDPSKSSTEAAALENSSSYSSSCQDKLYEIKQSISNVSDTSATTTPVTPSKLELINMKKTKQETVCAPTVQLQRDLSLIGDDRICRSLSILGQSVSLDISSIPQQILPKSLLQSSLTKLHDTQNTSRANSSYGKSFTDKHSRSLPSLLSQTDKEAVPQEKTDSMVITTATYTYRGARLSTVQSRKPLSHRLETVWCRTDEGEWKGLTKRSEMKLFESRQKGLRIARAKANERRNAEKEIRASINKHYADSSPEKIRINLVKAAGIKGSVLGLDIVNAHKYLVKWQHASDLVKLAQARARGFVARCKVGRELKRVREERKKRHELESICATVSRSVMDFVTKTALRSVTRKIFSASFARALNLSGIRMVLSVHSKTRQGAKSRDLCASCNTQEFTQLYDTKTHQYYRDRVSCQCVWKHKREEWLLRGYNPIDCSIPHISLSEDRMRSEIELIRNMSFISPEEHKKRLVGKSFGDWEYLLLGTHTSNLLSPKDRELAIASASKDLAVLATLERVFSENLLGAVRGKSPLAVDFMHQFDFHSTSGPIIVYDPSSDNANNNICDWNWEPLLDIIRCERRLADLEHDMDILVKHHYRLEDRWSTEVQRMLYLHQVALEWNSMSLEDSYSSLNRTCDRFEYARLKVREVVTLSTQTLDKIKDEEKSQYENWLQAWDPVEDAISSEVIVQRRKLESLKKLHKSQYEENIIAHRTSVQELQYCISEVARLRGIADTITSIIAKLHHIIEMAKTKTAETKRIAQEAFTALSTTLSYPKHGSVPIERKLKILNYRLAYLRDPLVRARKENRLAWTAAYRRVVLLKSLPGPVKWPRQTRVVVTVYVDPVTNYFIVQVGQVEVGLEETQMHFDFRLSRRRYSRLTSDPERNEILLKRDEIDMILSKEPNWPVLKDAPVDLIIRDKTRKLSIASNINNVPDAPVSSEVHQLENEDATNALSSVTSVTSCLTPVTPNTFMTDSRRSRDSSLTIQPYYVKDDRFSRPAQSYYLRHKNQEESDRLFYERIVSYLRLHPHSGRPSLGLLHLLRRRNVTLKALLKSLWYRDGFTYTPSSWSNEIFAGARFVAERTVSVVMRESWGEVEVKLTMMRGTKISIVIPFLELVKSFSCKPLLLACFLCEVITNKYSFDVLEHIICHMDLLLPGEGRRWWREPFYGEIATAKFISAEENKYRGSIYCTHRIIAGKYFSIRFFRSSRGDLKLELGKPINTVFWKHEYVGEVLPLEISIEELRALVLKISNDPHLLPRKLLKSVDLLRSEHQETLFTLLVDMIVLNPAIVRENEVKDIIPTTTTANTTTNRNQIATSARYQNTRSSISSIFSEQLEEIQHQVSNLDENENEWIDILQQRFQNVVHIFNIWATKRKPGNQSLTDSQLEFSNATLRHLVATPNLRLLLKRTPYSEKLLQVYTGYCLIGNSERLKSETAIDSLILINQHDHHSLIDYNWDTKNTKKNNRSLKLQGNHPDSEKMIYARAIGFDFRSLWLTSVSIDEMKLFLCLRVKHAHNEDRSAQSCVMAEESRLMSLEDDLSYYCNYESEFAATEKVLTTNLFSLKQQLAKEIQDLYHIQQKATQTNQKLETALHHLFTTIDSSLVSRALACFGVVKDKMKLGTDDLFQCTAWKLTDTAVDQDMLQGGTATMTPTAHKCFQSKSINLNNRMMTKTSLYYSASIASLMVWLNEVYQGFFEQMKVIGEAVIGDTVLLVSQHKGASKGKAKPDVHPPSVSGGTTSLTCRYCLTGDCSQHSKFLRTFREPESWQRFRSTNRVWESAVTQRLTSQMIRSGEKDPFGKHDFRVKIKKFRGGRILLFSEPHVGPYDLCTIHIYEPSTKAKWCISFAPMTLKIGEHMLFNPPNPMDHTSTIPQSARPRKSIDIERSLKSNIDQRSDSIAAIVAKGVVWNAMIKGLLSATVTIIKNQSSSIPLADAEYYVQSLTNKVQYYNRQIRKLSDGNVPYADIFSLRSGIPSLTSSSSCTSPSVASVPSSYPTIPGVSIYGMYVPVFDSVLPTVIEIPPSTSSSWNAVCTNYLESKTIERFATAPVLVFRATNNKGMQHIPNNRVNNWIQEYVRNVGWRKGVQNIKHRNAFRKNKHLFGSSFVSKPLFYGHVVILFRFGKSDLLHFKKWCNEKYDALQREKEEKRRLEEEKKQRILKNFERFRQLVFDTAYRYLWAFEKLNGCIPQSPTYPHLETQPCAGTFATSSLIQHAKAKLNQPYDSTIGLPRGTFLIDQDIIQNKLTSSFANAFFDMAQFPSGNSLLVFEEDKRPSTSAGENTSLTVCPRAIDVYYAVYQLHCFNCQRAPSYCAVKGCGVVRGWALTLEEQIRESERRHGTPPLDLDSLRGTGSHPLEKSLKRFMGDEQLQPDSTSPLTQGNIPDFEDVLSTTSSQILGEDDTDFLLDSLQYRSVLLEAALCRYLNRRLISPELKFAITPEESLEAKGGPWEKDEIKLPFESIEGLTTALPAPAVETGSDTLSVSSEEEDDIAALPLADRGESLLKIPISIINSLLGGGQDARGFTLPLWAIDPYPAKKITLAHHSEMGEQAMSDDLYSWLVNRLCIHQTTLQQLQQLSHPGTVLSDSFSIRSNPMEKALELTFDRMHCEGVVKLPDGSIVLLQVLQGILSATIEDMNTTRHSTPTCAYSRYLSSSDLMRMKHGLTLLVYDQSSHISRTVFVDGKLLTRVAEFLHIEEDDLTKISSALLTHANLMLRITRIGNLFTAVEIDTRSGDNTSLPTTGNTMKKPKNIKPSARKYCSGLRGFVIDKRNNALEAAKEFLLNM